MSLSSLESLKIKAKLLQKSKKKKGIEIQLKEAFQIIAKAAGFESWRELSSNFEETDLFNPSHWSAQWKVWFGNLDDARAQLEEDKFLLPYHKQFFICDIHYIKALGISENDSDLKLIGHDWTRPQNKAAWSRVLARIRNAQKS